LHPTLSRWNLALRPILCHAHGSMIARRIPLPALAAFALGFALPLSVTLSAQQPGAAAQPPAPASPAPAARTNTTAASLGKRTSTPPANTAPAPQGNLTIEVMDDNGTPFPGADVEIDGMRTGQGPAGVQPSTIQPSGTQTGDAQASGAQPHGAEAGEAQVNCTVAGSVRPGNSQTGPHSGAAQGAGSQSGVAQTGNGQTGGNQPQPGGQQLNTAQPSAGRAVDSHNRPTQRRPAESANGSSGSGQSGSGQPGDTKADSQPAAAQPDGDSLNTVQPGTAQAINCQAGAAPSEPQLPPGVVALRTDAQGQLTLQLANGPHTVSVSVYGFDPFTGHFTLSGKHRQMIQIKLSTAPTSFILAVGPDGRIQPVSVDLDALIPLEPVQTLDPLPARTRRHLI
jgi:hypothetical protein